MSWRLTTYYTITHDTHYIASESRSDIWQRKIADKSTNWYANVCVCAVIRWWWIYFFFWLLHFVHISNRFVSICFEHTFTFKLWIYRSVDDGTIVAGYVILIIRIMYIHVSYQQICIKLFEYIFVFTISRHKYGRRINDQKENQWNVKRGHAAINLMNFINFTIVIYSFTCSNPLWTRFFFVVKNYLLLFLCTFCKFFHPFHAETSFILCLCPLIIFDRP